MAKNKRQKPGISPMEALRRARLDDREDAGGLPEPEDLLAQILGIWRTADVSAQPHLTLVRWRVFQGGHHLVLAGWCVENGYARRSTPIVSTDFNSMRVTTQSGRVYQLEGPPGWDPDADHLLDVHACVGIDYKDVTEWFLRQRDKGEG